MTDNTNMPAFPAPDLGDRDFGDRSAYTGMTLRDYFAAKAMQGLMGRARHRGEVSSCRRALGSSAASTADPLAATHRSRLHCPPRPLRLRGL